MCRKGAPMLHRPIPVPNRLHSRRGCRPRPSGGRGIRGVHSLLVLSLTAALPLIVGCAATTGGTAVQSSELTRGDECRAVGDWDGAIAAYDALLGRPECAPPVESIRAFLGRADAHVRRGAPSAGKIDAEVGLAGIEVDGLTDAMRREFEQDARTILGEADLALDRPASARAQFRRALELAQSARDKDLLTYSLYLCARTEGSTSAGNLLSQLSDRNRPEFRELDRRFGAPAAPIPVPATPTWTAPPTSRTAVVDARPRSTWRALPAKRNKDPMTRIQRITVHHSGFPVTATDESSAAQALLSIQRDHQNSRGWADIGYHYLIDRAGRVWEGREIKYQGAHAGNPELNRGNVGICFLGDYRTQDVTVAQRSALFEVLDALRHEHGIPRARVEGHREVKGGTLCPGMKLEAVVTSYRRGIEPVARAN